MSEEEPGMDQVSKTLWLLAFKRQQLQHRRAIILKAQEFSSAALKESINLSELETIQADLQETLQQQDAVLKSGKLQKNPHDVQLYGESVLPVPDYEVPEELIPEPDYPISEEPSLDPDHNTPEEPTPEANQNTSVPVETVSQYETPENSVVVTVDKLVREPGWVTCSSCSRVVQTVVKHKVTDNTWIFCTLLSTVGCVFGCCLIPFCVKSLKDISHHCPNCNAKIHTVSRI